jgi:nitrogen fixation NifU-like protein
MRVYSAELLEHFKNPQNTGVVENADATVCLENPVCGDVLELSVKVERDQVVEIRFRAKGCVPVVACGSAITELAKGKSLEAARRIRSADLLKMVGGVPQASNHASQLAMDALDALLNKL